jgi:hypothetical protein
MNRGVPPTDRNARTGEFTPPGIKVFARENSLPDVFVLRGATSLHASLGEVDPGRVEIVTVPLLHVKKARQIQDFSG